ncbi:hypothetical protein C1645_818685 [Glomus cerebriforme]|uniref:Uncharacterized protein n=1 Tax=Glomus cerebriforme TaxID=658196 RepID=A0A397TG97_9GLOM|nr:hypothetical protein C1645_818685 [Glomus cerebriforme]
MGIDKNIFSHYLGLSTPSKHNKMITTEPISQEFLEFCNLPLEEVLPSKSSIQTTPVASYYFGHPEVLDLDKRDSMTNKHAKKINRKVQKQTDKTKETEESNGLKSYEQICARKFNSTHFR